MTRTGRVLLRLYPRSFRERFQPEVEQILRSSTRSHHGDLARGAMTEQWRETMATTSVRAADHPIAVGVFGVALMGTAVGALLTVAWVGFAPLALAPGIVAWTAGRRSGLLRPTSRARSRSSRVVLAVIAAALLLTSLMWGLRGVVIGA
jgi:hypothetical protein